MPAMSKSTTVYVRVNDKVVEQSKLGVCSHRGAEIDPVDCLTCEGKNKARTWTCDLHKKATLFTVPIPGLKYCGDCPDNDSLRKSNPQNLHALRPKQ